MRTYIMGRRKLGRHKASTHIYKTEVQRGPHGERELHLEFWVEISTLDSRSNF